MASRELGQARRTTPGHDGGPQFETAGRANFGTRDGSRCAFEPWTRRIGPEQVGPQTPRLTRAHQSCRRCRHPRGRSSSRPRAFRCSTSERPFAPVRQHGMTTSSRAFLSRTPMRSQGMPRVVMGVPRASHHPHNWPPHNAERCRCRWLHSLSVPLPRSEPGILGNGVLLTHRGGIEARMVRASLDVRRFFAARCTASSPATCSRAILLEPSAPWARR